MGLSADFAKDEALLQIVEGFLRLEDLSKATDLGEEIQDAIIFAGANLRVAVARGKGAEPGEATKYLDEVRDMIVETEAYGQQEANVRDRLIVDLALAYANNGNYAEARRTIQLVIFDETRELALKELGKLCAGAGAEQEVSEIEKALRSAYDKTQYWLGIYDATTSETAMTNALAIAGVLDQPVEKAEAFTAIALRFAKGHRATETDSVLLAATNAATLIEGSFLQARAFLHLAKASQILDTDSHGLGKD
jgi:hypothetical protein